MELKRDLLVKGKKSVLRIIFGIIFFVLSIFWIGFRVRDHHMITAFDWLYAGLFALNGIVHSMEGFGFPLARLVGKAFILINEERISIKTGISDKKQSIDWKDIKSIDYKLNKLHIQKKDQSNLTMNLSKLEYALKNEIKEIVGCIAKENNLKSNIND